MTEAFFSEIIIQTNQQLRDSNSVKTQASSAHTPTNGIQTNYLFLEKYHGASYTHRGLIFVSIICRLSLLKNRETVKLQAK